jgi:arylsulfatase A-like enzyme
MNRREFLKSMAATAAAMKLSADVFGAEQMETNKEKPNFIIILTDDQGYQDLGCYGSPLIKTPNLDKMAKEGMKFTDFYATAPICSPSRASLMTGCYPLRVGIVTVLMPKGKIGLNPSEVTIAKLLKGEGYSTACIGKWHLGDGPELSPLKHGFDYFFGLPFSNDDDHPEYGPEFPKLVRNNKTIEAPADRNMMTRKCTDEALTFIENNKNNPFFLYLSHPMPHVKLGASRDVKGKSNRGLYGDTIEEIDASTGEIFALLKKLNLDEKTLVIFASDNGPWLQYGQDGGSSEPLRGGKFSTFEGGMRVPCIMRWPGKIPAGTVCSEMATMMDFLPTMAKLAGAEIPEKHIIDGKDIWPLMSGETGAKSPYEALYYYWLGYPEAVRSGQWKLHLGRRERFFWRFKDQPENQSLWWPIQLYDLKNDIGEKNNVAEQHPDIVKCLLSVAEQFEKELMANCRPPGKIGE